MFTIYGLEAHLAISVLGIFAFLLTRLPRISNVRIFRLLNGALLTFAGFLWLVFSMQEGWHLHWPTFLHLSFMMIFFIIVGIDFASLGSSSTEEKPPARKGPLPAHMVRQMQKREIPLPTAKKSKSRFILA